jgi:Leucine-rich repeat (LRR) protein
VILATGHLGATDRRVSHVVKTNQKAGMRFLMTFAFLFSAIALIVDMPIKDDVDKALMQLGATLIRRDGVVEVHYYESSASATDFRLLAKLKNLVKLDLATSNVLDDHVANITEFHGLTELNLTRTRITDKAIESVKTNSNLRALYLGETAVSDRGVASLAILRKLMVLNLSHTGITSKACDTLRTMRELQRLDLNDTQIDDDAIAKLGDLPYLSSLGLIGTKITNMALAHLARRNKHLQELDVQGCNLDDDCVESLVQLKSLKKLAINGGTRISIKGARKLCEHARLEELWIGGASVEAPTILDVLKEARNLRVLHLFGMPSLPKAKLDKQIRQLRNLIEIHFVSCEVDQETVDRIKAVNPKLKIELFD